MPKSALDSQFFVGRVENPVAIIKRGEVFDYLDERLLSQITLWKKWQKFGLPFPGTWFYQPAFLVDTIELIDDTITSIRG